MHEQAQTNTACSEERCNPQSREFHHLSKLFPLMDEAELEELAEDIRKQGLREPIVLHEGLILDGRNRYRACQRADIEPKYREFDGADPLEYVVSANLHRRHLDDRQRAMIGAEVAKLLHGQRQRGQLASVPTQTQAARLLNVKKRSLKRAAKVQACGTPELVDAVKQGKVSLARAEKMASKPAEHQRKEIANPAAAKPRDRRKPTEERAPELNSISWSQATSEKRARFVDAVGLHALWEAAGPDQRQAFIERHRTEWERHAAPSNPQRQIAQSEQTDPLEISEYLHQPSRETAAPVAQATITNLELGSDASQSA
jgi:ParB-like chromosome segregation protein Spo0J